MTKWENFWAWYSTSDNGTIGGAWSYTPLGSTIRSKFVGAIDHPWHNQLLYTLLLPCLHTHPLAILHFGALVVQSKLLVWAIFTYSHFELGRIEGYSFFTQIMLIEGLLLFLHEKCIEIIWLSWGKRIMDKLVFWRYISCTFLTYNTCGSCTILMHF
jgi:hypothetical protein